MAPHEATPAAISQVSHNQLFFHAVSFWRQK
jgi:hypothetical protein